MPTKVSFRVFTDSGKPVSGLQVIVRACGRFEYGLTDRTGLVQFPLASQESGKVIILGRTRYLGDLGLQRIVLN